MIVLPEEQGLVRWGVVWSIDRANRRLRAVIDGVLHDDVTYDSRPGFAPWPFAEAWFQGGPPWRCVGPIGHRRVLFHDDFTASSTATPLLVGYASASQSTGTGAGVLALAHPGTTSMIAHDEGWMGSQDDDHAIHLWARVAATGITGSVQLTLTTTANRSTFANPSLSGVAAAGALFEMGGTDVDGNTPVDGTSYADDAFFLLEMMLPFDGHAFGWVDGNGPSRSTTGLSASAPRALAVGTAGAGSGTLLVDEWGAAVVSRPSIPDL